MAAGFVPSIIETVEKAMESLRLREALRPDDEALTALRRKVVLEIGQLDLPESRFPENRGQRAVICKWPANSARA
jgi:hypothetical protein